MNDIKVGQVWENKHLFNDAYDVVVCWVNDGSVWSHYTDDDDLVKESQSDFLRLRRLKSDTYFVNDDQKIVLEWLKSETILTREAPILSVNAFSDKNLLGKLPDKVRKAYKLLDCKQEYEVLAAFAQWGLEQEEA